jgi:hypothetical protein
MTHITANQIYHFTGDKALKKFEEMFGDKGMEVCEEDMSAWMSYMSWKWFGGLLKDKEIIAKYDEEAYAEYCSCCVKKVGFAGSDYSYYSKEITKIFLKYYLAKKSLVDKIVKQCNM